LQFSQVMLHFFSDVFMYLLKKVFPIKDIERIKLSSELVLHCKETQEKFTFVRDEDAQDALSRLESMIQLEKLKPSTDQSALLETKISMSISQRPGNSQEFIISIPAGKFVVHILEQTADPRLLQGTWTKDNRLNSNSECSDSNGEQLLT